MIAPIDALYVINYINLTGAGSLPLPAAADAVFLDPSGDNVIAPDDALLVINWINLGPQAEGEFAPITDGGESLEVPTAIPLQPSTSHRTVSSPTPSNVDNIAKLYALMDEEDGHSSFLPESLRYLRSRTRRRG